MKLLELFKDTEAKWVITHQSGTDLEAEFTIGEVKYEFTADERLKKGESVWYIEFRTGAREWDKRYGLTGTGNAAKVLSVVVDIMKFFLKEYPNVRKLSFDAEEQSRQDLYARMVHRLLPNWELEKDGIFFTLTAPVNTK